LTRRFPVFLFFLSVLSLCQSRGEEIPVRSPLGTEVVFLSSSFEPGQVVLARLKDDPGVKYVVIRFLDKNYELRPLPQKEEPFALIGLDLGLKPGPHIFEVTIFRKDGRTELLGRKFSLVARDFPVKKLWVKQEFVTPPPEVQARIQWEAELLQSIYSVSTPRWMGQGKFIVPHEGEISPNFGERRIYNNVPRSTHSGVDIRASAGSPVHASNSGKVVLARDLYFSGKTVILDHGLGLFTYYCHFSRIKVKIGDTVRKGDIIGLVGSTGRSTGPHLHWGVKILESRVDPLALLGLPL
jgi:murein DD-endopeptidase MepM/ murein hydrolase activator NlpD